MNPTPLYDLSPLAQLLGVGAVLALLPAAWVWRKNRRALVGQSAFNGLHALTLATLFLTFDLVLFGAFTRLSDSGLGCPDWPGCYGQASPVGAVAQITQAQANLADGPVTHAKAWIEMLHRYLATAVGALILLMALCSWRARRVAAKVSRSTVNPWWATATLLWVCLQGAFGALTVAMKLFPAIVTLHLLGGMVLLGLLGVQVTLQIQERNGIAPVPIAPGLRRCLWFAAAVLVLQVALGGWVSTNYAVLACQEFPRCQQLWWPDMNFEQGFQLWRELGLTSSGEHISFAALTAIHFVHRLMAGLVAVVLLGLAWLLRPVAPLQASAHWLAFLVLLQTASGLGNVLLNWPMVVALLHTGGAAAMVLLLSQLLGATRRALPSVTGSETGSNTGSDKRGSAGQNPVSNRRVFRAVG